MKTEIRPKVIYIYVCILVSMSILSYRLTSRCCISYYFTLFPIFLHLFYAYSMFPPSILVVFTLELKHGMHDVSIVWSFSLLMFACLIFVHVLYLNMILWVHLCFKASFLCFLLIGRAVY